MDPFNLTDAERNAPAGMSTIDGGVMTGNNPLLNNVPAPVAAPAQSAPAQSVVTGEPVAEPAPTNMETLQGIKTEALRIQDILNQREEGSGFAAPGVEQGTTTDPFDVEAEQRRSQRAQLKLHQAEIDATNQVYDQLLNEARVQGQGRIGSTRAIGARGGILGSDFAGAQKQAQIGANTQEQRGIQAERTAKIGNIMGTVRSAALADVEQRRLAYSTNADAVLADIKGQKERRQNNINSFAQALLAQGIDIEDLSPEELNAFATESGIAEDELRNGYAVYKSQADAQGAAAGLETRKTEAEIRKIDADIASGELVTLGEGTMLYNPSTGESFKNPKTYKPGSASGLSLGGGTLTQEAVADVHQVLNETRGADGYADTGAYMDEFNSFVALGGDPKDFLKEYDPNIYINPADETRSFLQAEMKKPASGNVFLGGLGTDFDSIIAEAESEVGG